MKILIDMNLSPTWADFLSNVGLSAMHWASIGAVNATDHEIVQYAKHEDYIILTHDLDFSAILAATDFEKPSVVQIRADDTRPDAIGAAVVRALRQMENELKAGALLTIDPTRVRVRLLPLLVGR